MTVRERVGRGLVGVRMRVSLRSGFEQNCILQSAVGIYGPKEPRMHTDGDDDSSWVMYVIRPGKSRCLAPRGRMRQQPRDVLMT